VENYKENITSAKKRMAEFEKQKAVKEMSMKKEVEDQKQVEYLKKKAQLEDHLREVHEKRRQAEK
jgi:hypothetical protein